MGAKMDTDNPKEFYESYRRCTGIVKLIQDDDFMYGPVIKQIQPYLHPGAKVLDLGCNDGILSLYMAMSGCDVLGIDIAPNAIKSAINSRNHHKLYNAQFKSMDFILEWDEPEIFDLVVCNNVVEHVLVDDIFLDKIFFSLKPRGKLVQVGPTSYSSVYNVYKAITGKFPVDEEEGHLRRYTKKSFQTLVKSSGFKIDRMVFLDSILRDWFIVFKPLRPVNRCFYLPIIRNIINDIDYFLANLPFYPGAICIHATRK